MFSIPNVWGMQISGYHTEKEYALHIKNLKKLLCKNLLTALMISTEETNLISEDISEWLEKLGLVFDTINKIISSKDDKIQSIPEKKKYSC